jgi:hypothetical protein
MDLNDVGQRFILPSSYTGGPRYMKQCLQDSLALARYYRSIDLFITHWGQGGSYLVGKLGVF